MKNTKGITINDDSIKGLYIQDCDNQRILPFASVDEPLKVLEEIGLKDCILYCSEMVKDKMFPDTENYIHVLIRKETFNFKPEFEVAIAVQKEDQGLIGSKALEYIDFGMAFDPRRLPITRVVWNFTPLETHKPIETLALFERAV